jgi:hypothetical protein
MHVAFWSEIQKELDRNDVNYIDLICLRVGTGGANLWTQELTCGFREMLRSS